MAALDLVLGPARSGKSRLAEQLASAYGPRVVYVATLEPLDDEMRDRVRLHRASRPGSWLTVEEPLEVVARLSQHADADAHLLDCLTLWSSNLLLASGAGSTPDTARRTVLAAIEGLIAWQERSSVPLVVVSNEVGAGIVPEYELGRLYRDVLGEVNQLLATAADRLYYTVAGQFLELKGLGARPIPRQA
jgi:adenosylcobinamide kinase/adenosylcobinamide-phosphate guanylyltransferase